MLKLGLIGKNISHSKSPEIYQRLIKIKHSYELLDYDSEDEIPLLADFAQRFNGLNITSPYKKHFLNEVKLTENAMVLGAINCLKFVRGETFGENTDYLAIVDILEKYKTKSPLNLEVVILGDGVMSQVLQHALKKCGLSFDLYSRKKTNEFDQLKLDCFSDKCQPLIINTCSRDYIFKGSISSHSFFWDFNYNFQIHQKQLAPLVALYNDGYEILELQARYAVAFWSID